MKNTTKGILATIPLIVGLAGPAAAAMADTAAADGVNSAGGSESAIVSLLNQYAGLDPGNQNSVTQTVPPSQQLSSFTGAAGAMNTYFTALGVDRTSPNQPFVPDGVIGSSSDSSSTAGGSGSDPVAAAAAPAVAVITVARFASDSLVGAVASASAPTSSSANNAVPINVAGETPPVLPVPEPIPTPIPPAAALIGSGLTALAALRKRNQGTLAE